MGQIHDYIRKAAATSFAIANSGLHFVVYAFHQSGRRKSRFQQHLAPITPQLRLIGQTTVSDSEGGGRGFTDVIVNLPDGRRIVVDSKVSLNDYEQATSAKEEADIKQFMEAHVRAVKGHIDSLASKQYHKKVADAVEFTIMFIPIEPAYMAALDKDGGLWHYAYSKNIMLVSPSNLLPCLHIVKDLWHRDKLSREAANIARRAELLYDKVRGFVESFYAVGNGLERAQGEFDKAKGQLETGAGNITSQANELRRLVGSNKLIKGAPEEDTQEE